MTFLVTNTATSEQTECKLEQLATTLHAIAARESAGVRLAVAALIEKIEHKQPIGVEESFLGARVVRVEAHGKAGAQSQAPYKSKHAFSEG
jgi:hypothetical protein